MYFSEAMIMILTEEDFVEGIPSEHSVLFRWTWTSEHQGKEEKSKIRGSSVTCVLRSMI